MVLIIHIMGKIATFAHTRAILMTKPLMMEISAKAPTTLRKIIPLIIVTPSSHKNELFPKSN